MRNRRKLKILFAGEELEKFTSQIDALKEEYDFFVNNSHECLLSSLSIKDLSLIFFQKRNFKNFCISCIKRIKGFMSQTVIVVLCEAISKEDMCTLFRYGVRDVVEQPLGKTINLKEVLTKFKFIFPDRPEKCERRYNDLLLKHIKKFPLLNQNLSEDKRIERAKAYIENHYNCPIALGEIAKVAYMSKYHFCRTFRTREGVSFKEYLNNVRIEKAEKLLRGNRFSITEIAYEVGFNSPSLFAKLFKSHLNISPSNFRKIALKTLLLFSTCLNQCIEQLAFLLF